MQIDLMNLGDLKKKISEISENSTFNFLATFSVTWENTLDTTFNIFLI